MENGNLVFEKRITSDAYHAIDMGIISSEVDANDLNCYFCSDTPNKEDYQPISAEVAQQHLSKYQSGAKPLSVTFTPLT